MLWPIVGYLPLWLLWWCLSHILPISSTVWRLSFWGDGMDMSALWSTGCLYQLIAGYVCREIERNKKKEEVNCFKCKEKLTQEYLLGLTKDNVVVSYECDVLSPVRCLICQNMFHKSCFSRGTNSINCWSCEQQIRSKQQEIQSRGPKAMSNLWSIWSSPRCWSHNLTILSSSQWTVRDQKKVNHATQ